MKIKAKVKRFFCPPEGGLRTGWKVFLGIAAYTAAFYVVLEGLSALCSLLFHAWGLTTSNLAYAPMWAQRFVAWHSGVIYAMAYLVSLIVGLLLARKWSAAVKGSRKVALYAGLSGLALGIWVTLCALIPDSMRMEWPLGEPVFSWTMLASVLLMILGKLSGQILTKRLILDVLRVRLGKIAAILLSCLAAWILSGQWTNVIGIVNAWLVGWIGCELYLRGGLTASASFEIGWTLWTTKIFADPASSAASLYRLYHVSEAAWTGGNAGFECGLACTLGCVLILVFLYQKSIGRLQRRIKSGGNKHGEDQNCNRRTGVKGRGHLRSGTDGNDRPHAGGRSGGTAQRASGSGGKTSRRAGGDVL